MDSKITFLCFLILGVCQCWDYSDQDEWTKDNPLCNGKSQSPINIVSKTAIVSPMDLHSVYIFNFLVERNWTISNNGNTIIAVPDTKFSKVLLSGVNNGNHEVLGFTFRWGPCDIQSSEHSIDGKYFPLELQLNAKADDGSLSQLAYFFEISSQPNDYLKPVLEAFSNVPLKGDSVVAKFSMAAVLNNEDSVFSLYRYEGSLTQPPCTESVTWTISTKKLPISADQLASLKKKVVGITDNRRRPQPLNGRTIKTRNM